MIDALASNRGLTGSAPGKASASHGPVDGIKGQIDRFTSQFPKANVSISPQFLKKMETDPAAAAKIKEFVDGLPAAQQWLENQLSQFGSKLVSINYMVDAEGNVSSFSVSTRSSDPSNDNDDDRDEKKKSAKIKRHESDKRDSLDEAVADLMAKFLQDVKEGEMAASAERISKNKIDVLA